jgi:DNA-binding response OmpR family regulator
MKKSQFVMIVDDDRAWAERIAELFVAYGYEAAVIASGKAALEHARRRDVDIAFLGVQTPALSGVDSELRKLKPAARIVPLERPLAFERMLEIVETAA